MRKDIVMWEFFNKIQSYDISPNECLFLFGIKEKITPSRIKIEMRQIQIMLTDKGLIEIKDGVYVLTDTGSRIVRDLEIFYDKKSKQDNIQKMGKDFKDMVTQYRELFPKSKLPSGKLARNNVNTLIENFKWFFSTYDYTWDDVIKATKAYIKEYRNKDWQYMKTSQYFISKQDKHKVKVSELADYCDMIKDGVHISDEHFKEKVV